MTTRQPRRSANGRIVIFALVIIIALAIAIGLAFDTFGRLSSLLVNQTGLQRLSPPMIRYATQADMFTAQADVILCSCRMMKILPSAYCHKALWTIETAMAACEVLTARVVSTESVQ